MYYSNSLMFKRLAEIAERASKNYPPFNIRKNSQNEYVIEMALAGFNKSDIEVTMEGGDLKISGKSKVDNNHFLYKGIASRDFERSFILNDTIKIKNAYWANGMLRIVLDSLLPKQEKIEIEDEPEDFNSVR